MIHKYRELTKKAGFLDLRQELKWVEEVIESTNSIIIQEPVISKEYKRAFNIRSYFLPIRDRITNELKRVQCIRVINDNK